MLSLVLIIGGCGSSNDDTDAVRGLEAQVIALEEELRAVTATTTIASTTTRASTTTTVTTTTTAPTTTVPATTTTAAPTTTVATTTTVAPLVTLHGALEFAIPTRWVPRTDMSPDAPCPEQETYASGRITVSDAAGRIIAVGGFLESEWFDFGEIIVEPDYEWDRVEARCRVYFAVHGIPPSDFYVIDLAGGPHTLSRAEMEYLNWNLEVGFFVPGRA